MLFTRLYLKALDWAKAPHAPHYLAMMSACESIFWPIPVDIMLAPMSLARPNRAVLFATIATLASVAGALLGYVLGYFLFEPLIVPFLEFMHYQDEWNTARVWFDQWGIWVVFVAGFSPIPYKIFTVTSGSLHMALLPFLAISLVSRGLRFFLVALLMRWGGEALEQKLLRHIEYLGWLCVILAIGAYWFLSAS